MKDLVIVSDPGIDDAVALVLVDKMLPEVPKLLLSTFGNASGETTAKNARDISKFLGNNWRFEPGPDLPINGTVEHPWPDYFHGADALWGIKTPIRKSTPTDHSFSYHDILSLGPLTAISNILSKYKVRRLTIMGGAFDVPGNETPFAETNIAFDSDAARLVFDSIHNITTRVIPLDSSRKVRWPIQKVDRIVADSSEKEWLKQLILEWDNRYDHAKEKEFNLHDPLAVFLSIYPELVEWRMQGVKVITEGEQRGRTVFDDTKPTCLVAPSLSDHNDLSDKIFSTLF